MNRWSAVKRQSLREVGPSQGDIPEVLVYQVKPRTVIAGIFIFKGIEPNIVQNAKEHSLIITVMMKGQLARQPSSMVGPQRFMAYPTFWTKIGILLKNYFG